MFRFFLVLAGSLISMNASTSSYACDGSINPERSATCMDQESIATPVQQSSLEAGHSERSINSYETAGLCYDTPNRAANMFSELFEQSGQLLESIDAYRIGRAALMNMDNDTIFNRVGLEAISRGNDIESDIANLRERLIDNSAVSSVVRDMLMANNTRADITAFRTMEIDDNTMLNAEDMFLRSNNIEMVTNLHANGIANFSDALQQSTRVEYTLSDVHFNIISILPPHGGDPVSLDPSSVSALWGAQAGVGEETDCMCCSNCMCCSIC